MAAEKEFLELRQRYLQAVDYEKTKYLNDTPEGKQWAEEELKRILDRMDELWEGMTDEEKQRHTES